MFADYTKLVLLDYEKKRAENALSLRLIHPSPAKLREECFYVRSRGYEKKKDEVALVGFFGDDMANILNTIKRFDIDKFRPLNNFLKKPEINTDQKNIELLAWLIDFELRPFELGRLYEVPEEAVEDLKTAEARNKEAADEANPVEGTAPAEEQELTDPDPGENMETEKKDGMREGPDQPEAPAPEAGTIKDPVAVETPGTSEQAEPDKGSPMGVAIPKPELRKPGSVFKRGLAVLAITLFAVAGFWIYRGGKKEPEPIPMGQALPANNACMRWTGDHYEQIPCRGTTGDTLVEPLDPEKIRSFKKITRPDTITRQSKGSVWYVKINKGKEIEFYTSDGFHPIDRQLRLKPVTDYIIEKHLHLAQAQNTGN
ncbi:hypothetical protein LQ567_18755 [Niabella pedocola]|uniref:Uncharacterized protein n=1 Tax=Niabella pedocola TaxID=1752077 RepID=A0ABS8PUS7_9BACT|nr:hypothetical protein [Niabella pedocola]MCD2424830.1 hypothetical protein [Niabella pedocola]